MADVVTETDFARLMEKLSNWGRWGADDELGTLNLITPERRKRAAALVREGVTVTCARPIVTEVTADTTFQPMRFMVDSGEGRGALLLLRTGYAARRLAPGRRHRLKDGSPAAHVACTPWFRERGIAMLGTDTHNDVSPTTHPAIGHPLHIACLVAMGLWLIDNCNLEDLARTCASLRRWEFMLSIAPLRLTNVTGSPVNPIAIF